MSLTTVEVASPRPIPTRDSSLRKTGSNARRSSTRISRSKRDSDTTDVIPEADEQNRTREAPRRRHQTRGSDVGTTRESAEILATELAAPSKAGSSARPSHGTSVDEGRTNGARRGDEETEEGAPFPAIAQGRRRDEYMDRHGRRRSGRNTPDPNESVRPKRSNSRLNRLSSPRGHERTNSSRRDVASPEPARSNMPIVYRVGAAGPLGRRCRRVLPLLATAQPEDSSSSNRKGHFLFRGWRFRGLCCVLLRGHGLDALHHCLL